MMSRHERNIPEYVFDNLDNLKAEALKCGYTLKVLEEKLGFARGLANHLASGIATPSRNTYNKVASVLGWQVWQ